MRTIEIPDYNASEMVRLELLAYPTPEGLHPIEHQWRDLAKKLLKHTKILQELAIELNEEVQHYKKVDLKTTKFPTVFDPNYNAISTPKV